MTKDEVLMMALEALKANDLLINGTEKAGGLAWCIDGYYSDCFDIDPINEQTERAITAIKEALAQTQEPVAWILSKENLLGTRLLGYKPDAEDAVPLYTHPPVPTAQPKQCTNSDSWNCKYCTKTETCEAINDHRNFGEPKEPEQEPVAWAWFDEADRRLAGALDYEQPPHYTIPLYTIPPKRTWVGLTDEEIEEVWEQVESSDFLDCVHPLARAIEAKLKEKNTHD